MARPLRALTYSRVSTERDQNPEAQRAELARYCEARGWEVVEHIVDHGYSGGTDQRPGLKQLLSMVRARQVDVVVVVKLDRLARSLRHLISMLDEFTSLGVLFVSVGDQIDLSTASGRLMLHLLGAFSEFERALIRERTLRGIDHARRQGRRLGRPKLRDDDTIRALRAQGESYREIERKIGTSRGAVYRALNEGVPKSPQKAGIKKLVKTGGQDAG